MTNDEWISEWITGREMKGGKKGRWDGLKRRRSKTPSSCMELELLRHKEVSE